MNQATRNSYLSKIHIAKKQLGLDDETYKSILMRVAGQDSCRSLGIEDLQKILDEFKAKGFKELAKNHKFLNKKDLSPQGGIYLSKLRALWLAAYHLDLVDNRKDEALEGFVKRQTKVSSLRFLIESQDARNVIEGLKAWIGRDRNVEWNKHSNPRVAVIYAQWDILKDELEKKYPFTFAGHIRVDEVAIDRLHLLPKSQLDTIIQMFGKKIRDRNKKKALSNGRVA